MIYHHKKPTPREKLVIVPQILQNRPNRFNSHTGPASQVVFATCTGAAVLHRELRRSGAANAAELCFDVVVIDEAAQALEVGCWIPLLLGDGWWGCGERRRVFFWGGGEVGYPKMFVSIQGCFLDLLFVRIF